MHVNTRPQLAGIPDPARPSRSNRRWFALIVLSIAQFLVVLDATIVNIALPEMGANLGLSSSAMAAVITAYVLPFGSLLLFGGRLADRFGHRRLTLIGVTGFVAASVAAGLSISGEMLLTARAVQGTSAALLAPAGLALVTQLFPLAADRTRALGIWAGVAGIGSAAGVLLGGLLTANLGWQSVFFINVPLGIFVIISIPLLITRGNPGTRARLDLLGAATITGALVALVASLSTAQQNGLTNPLALALLAGALVLGAAFIIIERRATSPLLPFGMFTNRNLAVGNLAMLLIGGATVSVFFVLSVYMQSVLGYSPLVAGITQLPLAGALVLTAGAVPALSRRIGVAATLIGSLLVVAAGLVWLAFAPADAQFAANLLGPSLLLGIGLGGSFVTATHMAVDGTGSDNAGLSGALINTSQQIGGAIGVTVLTAFAASRTAALQAAGSSIPEALTGGFSWLFLGAATIVLAAAAIVLIGHLRRPRTSHDQSTPSTS